MKKAYLFVFVAGGLVAAGMVLSFYGSALITQGVSITEGVVGPSSPLQIEMYMDRSISDTGVFVVHSQPQGSALVARVLDPAGIQIESKTIQEERTEEQFEIATSGSHTLVLDNAGSDVHALIGISHMPDKSLVALNIFGQAAIVSGFVGMGIGVLYAIVSRKRPS